MAIKISIPDLDQRVEAARRAVLPDVPLGYVFSPDARLGGFRVRALTESDLQIKNQPYEQTQVLGRNYSGSNAPRKNRDC